MGNDSTRRGDSEIQHPPADTEHTLVQWLRDYEICVASLRDSPATSAHLVDPENNQTSALDSNFMAVIERGKL